MKSKLTTYVLLAALIVVWGIIFRKIFFNDDSSKIEKNPQTKTAAKHIDSTEIKLLLDYRDPFLDGLAQNTQRKNDFPERQPLASEGPSREEITARYVGKVRSGTKEHYMIELSGTQYSIKKGEVIEGFRLATAFADSLHLAKNGYVYCLKLQ